MSHTNDNMYCFSVFSFSVVLSGHGLFCIGVSILLRDTAYSDPDLMEPDG